MNFILLEKQWKTVHDGKQNRNEPLNRQNNKSRSKTPATRPHATNQRLLWLITSTPYMLFMSILTIYTIFAIDIDKGFFSKGASVYFSTVHVISMCIFTVEIVVNCMVEKDYFLRFYFWIDVFSTLMMVLELIWIEDVISSTDNLQVAVSFARVSKASRFSKIGARSTKIMKLIRLIKLMKFFRKKQEEDKINQELQKGIQEGDSIESQSKDQQQVTTNKELDSVKKNKIPRPNVNPAQQQQLQRRWQLQSEQLKNKQKKQKKEEPNKDSRVGQILKYEIQKNIVIMVMGLIMIVPMFAASTWFNKTADMEPSTSIYAQIIAESNDSYVLAWFQSFVLISGNSTRPITKLSLGNYQFPSSYTEPSLFDLQNLRQSQQSVVQGDTFSAIFSKKTQTEITSWINMVRSVLIIVLLLITSIMFTKDLETYALGPLEKMSETVQKIEKNPFSVLQGDDQDNEDEIKEQPKQQEEMELQINILLKFFIKITSLLALGIGQTPFETQANLTQSEVNKLNIFQQANCIKMVGIFSCIQIANQQQLYSKLGDRAPMYINHILQMYHQTAIENGGYVFHQDEEYSLVCWKVGSGFDATTQKNVEIKQEEKRKAELAFIFYVKFCEKIAHDSRLKQLQLDHEISFSQDACRFHIGFHCGIAYCGTIGSEFKLSLRAMGNDVSIVKSLCRAAAKYRVESLLSENFLRFAPFAQLLCRKMESMEFPENKELNVIDTYSICGSINLRIHGRMENSTTMTSSLVHSQQPQQVQEINHRQRLRKLFRMRKQILKASTNKCRAEQLQNLCRSYLKKHQNAQQFLELWKQSCDYYEDGQWVHAKIGYHNAQQCNFISQNDVITEMRLDEIGSREEPPSNWQREKQLSLFL